MTDMEFAEHFEEINKRWPHAVKRLIEVIDEGEYKLLSPFDLLLFFDDEGYILEFQRNWHNKKKSHIWYYRMNFGIWLYAGDTRLEGLVQAAKKVLRIINIKYQHYATKEV